MTLLMALNAAERRAAETRRRWYVGSNGTDFWVTDTPDVALPPGVRALVADPPERVRDLDANDYNTNEIDT